MAQPIKIMMIRHGEKPTAKHQPPYGVTDAGEEDRESLTVRGWQRAGALATLFDPCDGRPRRPHLATPTVIFASKPREAGDAKDDDGSKSKRPLQTITPLAARLGLSPRLNFAAGDEEALASEVRQSSGVVLISWQTRRSTRLRIICSNKAPSTESFPTPGPTIASTWCGCSIRRAQPGDAGASTRFHRTCCTAIRSTVIA